MADGLGLCAVDRLPCSQHRRVELEQRRAKVAGSVATGLVRVAVSERHADGR